MFNQNLQKNQGIDIQVLFRQFAKRWYVFLGAVIVAVVCAFFYNLYSDPKYEVVATIEVDKGGSKDRMNMLFNQTGLGGGQSLMEDEIIKLKSFPILLATLEDLDFAVSYYDSNPINLSELYNNSPVRLNIASESTFIPYGEEIKCEFVDKENFKITIEGVQEQVLEFNKEHNINNFIFTLKLLDEKKINEYESIYIKINRLFDLVRNYQKKLTIISPIEGESSLLDIMIEGSNVEKELDFINAYLEAIVNFDVKEKRSFSEKSIQFIDNQLAENTDSLQIIEGAIKQFKYNQVPIDPTLESNQLYSNIRELEQEKANIVLSNQYYTYLLESLTQSDDVEEIVVPSSMGIQDNILNSLISKLVNLQLEVKMLMTDNKGKNPLVIEMQQTIKELKNNIITNVKNLKATNDIRIKDIESRMSLFASSLRQLPEAERQLKTIQRDYRVNEEIYLLLMQKRLEAGIQYSAIESSYKIINHPINNGITSAGPVKIYLLAILLALLIPAGVIYLYDLAEDKIQSKEEIKEHLDLPVVGSIFHQKKSVGNYHETPSFESFRSLRTNLKFLKQPTQVLLFSSSISGEGKSFCSSNMALSLAMSGKTVVWIDADLRKENKTYQYMNENELENGLTSYLTGLVDLNKIIIPGKMQNIYLIKTGIFPPNPGELLINDRMKELIAGLREQFDYVIIDTPPIGFFSDALELINFVDHTFLLVRENVSKRSAVKSIADIIRMNNLKNISLIYNDFSHKFAAYGYGYGKGYYNKKKKKSTEKSIIVNEL